MNWGKWIIVSFILFAVFIATLVAVCMRQDVSLVSKDYYKDELAYQDQIVRVNNAAQLTDRPVIKKNGKFLEVDFKKLNKIENGTLKLFRPSDPKMDKVIILQPSQGTTQSVPVDELKKGMYRARMQWVMNDKEYFIEEIIIL
jgi:hypothetical protein